MPVRSNFPRQQHDIASPFLPTDHPDWFSEPQIHTRPTAATLRSIILPAATVALVYCMALGVFAFIVHAAVYLFTCFS